MNNKDKKKILIATAFPTHGAGSGALVTTQAKSYVEDGHTVVIITGNNRTTFDKLDGVKYHIVPFTSEVDEPEKIDGQVPFNYLMFTTHTESTANFWNVSLEQLEQYCEAFRKALKDEVKNLNPEVIHAQHNWLLSSIATEMDKPVVTTIHGTDLMGYEKSELQLEEVNKKINKMKQTGKVEDETVSKNDIDFIEEIYKRSSSVDEIRREIGNAIKTKKINMSKAAVMRLVEAYDDQRKYEFYIREAKKSAKNSEKIIVISDAQKEKFNQIFPFAANKVELLENGYDPKIFYVDKNIDKEEVFSKLTTDKTPDGKISTDYDTLVLFVGKFADFKGIDSLLTAAKQYEEQGKEQGKKILTLIVGSGALEKKLKAQAETLQLENTHFVGRQPHEVICKLQNLADVSLIPSRNEPFGLVVIEGTACGHPVIASNSGGIPGILNTTKEQLPQTDIIKTDLGVLIRPLPERPAILTDEQKDELDIAATSYVIGNPENKKDIVSTYEQKFKLSGQELGKYFEDYSRSTTALSDSVMKVLNGELSFDNEKIATYTKEKYAQPIIRQNILNIFEQAKVEHEKKNMIEF